MSSQDQVSQIVIRNTDSLSDILYLIEEVKLRECVIIIPEDYPYFLDNIHIKAFAKSLKGITKDFIFYSNDKNLLLRLQRYGVPTVLEHGDIGDWREALFGDSRGIQAPKDSFGNLFDKNFSSQEEAHAPEEKFTREPVDNIVSKKEASKSRFKIKSFFTLYTVVLSILLMIVFGGFAAIFLPKATLNITSGDQIYNKDYQLTLDPKIQEFDKDNMKIPVKIESSMVEVMGDFEATGVKTTSEKVSGVVTVYNDTDTDQILVETTRFRTADQKQYRSTQQITVPPKGSKSVQILADAEGETYNLLEGTRLDIPGLKSSSYNYQNVYAKATQALSIGVGAQQTVITTSDRQKAEADLKNKLEEKLKTASSELETTDQKIVDVTYGDIEYISSQNEGTESSTFKMTAKSKMLVMKYEESVLKELVTLLLKEQLVDDQTLGEIYKTAFENPDVSFKESDTVTARVFVEYQVINDMDLEEIKKAVIGKSFGNVKEYMKKYKDVSKVDLEINPSFWPLMPFLKDNITIKVISG
jgi:ribosomal protein L21E